MRSAAFPQSQVPDAWRSQAFEGGLRPAVALDFNGPPITGNPFKGGFDELKRIGTATIFPEPVLHFGDLKFPTPSGRIEIEDSAISTV